MCEKQIMSIRNVAQDVKVHKRLFIWDGRGEELKVNTMFNKIDPIAEKRICVCFDTESFH